jgi:hypothetical protein
MMEGGDPPSWVVALTRKFAAKNGGPNPTSAQVALTTQQAAVSIDSGSWMKSTDSRAGPLALNSSGRCTT